MTTLALFLLLISQVAQSAEDVDPLSVGVSAPDSFLLDLSGNETSLHKVLGNEPSLLIFYRGGWCPYCTSQLGKLKSIEEELTNKGVKIVGLSPDRPEKLKETSEKESISYSLLSDSLMETSKAFGLAFKLDDATVAKYKNEYGIDVEGDSGQKHHLLPVPAAYLIDSNKQIVFAYHNPNYKVRVSHEDLLKAVNSLR